MGRFNDIGDADGLEARPVLPTVTPLVRGLEAFAGWESPAEYSASPPNSIALLLQWNVALSLMGTMVASLRDRCHKWQPSTPASAQTMEVDTPTSEVQDAAGSSTLTKAPASAEASAAVEATGTAPFGTGTSGEGGWKEAARKKKKGGSKPQGAVSLADLKSELSAISLGESQEQGQAAGGNGQTASSYMVNLKGWLVLSPLPIPASVLGTGVHIIRKRCLRAVQVGRHKEGEFYHTP